VLQYTYGGDNPVLSSFSFLLIHQKSEVKNLVKLYLKF